MRVTLLVDINQAVVIESNIWEAIVIEEMVQSLSYSTVRERVICNLKKHSLKVNVWSTAWLNAKQVVGLVENEIAIFN